MITNMIDYLHIDDYVDTLLQYYSVLKHSGVDNTGKTDSTEGLLDIFDNIGKYRNILFPPGEYVISKPLTILNGQAKVHIVGHGAKITAAVIDENKKPNITTAFSVNGNFDYDTSDYSWYQYKYLDYKGQGVQKCPQSKFNDTTFYYLYNAGKNGEEKWLDKDGQEVLNLSDTQITKLEKAFLSSTDPVGRNQLNDKYQYMLICGTLEAESTFSEFVHIEGLQFNGNYCASGIQLNKSQCFVINNCHINNCYKGIEIANCWYGDINNMTRLNNCKYGIILSGREVNIINLENISIKNGTTTTSTKNTYFSKEKKYTNSTGVVLACPIIYTVKFNGLTIEGYHYGVKAIKRYNKNGNVGWDGVMEFNNNYFEAIENASFDFSTDSDLPGLQYIFTTEDTQTEYHNARRWKTNINNLRCLGTGAQNIIIGLGDITLLNCENGIKLDIEKSKPFSLYRTSVTTDFALNKSFLDKLDKFTVVKSLCLSNNRIYGYGPYNEEGGDQTYPKDDILTLLGVLENFYIQSPGPQETVKNHIMTEFTPYSLIYYTTNALIKPNLPVVLGILLNSKLTGIFELDTPLYFALESFNNEIKSRQLGTNYLNREGYSGQELYNKLCLTKYKASSGRTSSFNFTSMDLTELNNLKIPEGFVDDSPKYFCRELGLELYPIEIKFLDEGITKYSLYFVDSDFKMPTDLTNISDIMQYTRNYSKLGTTQLLLEKTVLGLSSEQDVYFYDVYTNQIIGSKIKNDEIYHRVHDNVFRAACSSDIAYYTGNKSNPWDGQGGSDSLKTMLNNKNLPRMFFCYKDEDNNIQYSFVSSDIHSESEKGFLSIGLSKYITNNFENTGTIKTVS